MSELNCPAQTRGAVAACRFCIFTGGGPSNLCLNLAERFRKDQAARHLQFPLVSSDDNLSISQSLNLSPST
ncbi:MAG: hypothetical protein HZC40_10230 [Chloroflexi bacterium]|nr:hypothetical protein [Chloroflexota bacterium]